MSRADVGIRPVNDASLEAVQRQMRFVAYQQRRSAAPRCHPISIFVIVQAIGCIFMGLTMTIAGHWPGTGSRSVIILQTLGPVIVALGVLLLVIGILLARFLRKKEAKTWDKKISQHIMSTSRQVLDQSIPMYHMGLQAKPAFGPSTEEERKELLLSPSSVEEQLARKAAAFSPSDSETFNSSSSAIPPLSNEDVPDPVRVTKVKKKNAGSSSSLENLDSIPEVSTRSTKRSKKTITGEEEEELSGVSRTVKKHTTVTTTTVTKRIVDESDDSEKPARAPKLKPPPPVPKKPSAVPDSPRLRVKVKASPGTSVNIRQSGSSFDEEASIGYHRSQENVGQSSAAGQPKPRTKPKKQGKFEGTDI